MRMTIDNFKEGQAWQMYSYITKVYYTFYIVEIDKTKDIIVLELINFPGVVTHRIKDFLSFTDLELIKDVKYKPKPQHKIKVIDE